jgi:Prenyltransferase and squalene oxidase repeat
VTKTYRGVLLLLCAVVCLLLAPAVAAAAVPASVTKALDYLHTRQRDDGGFSYSSSSGNASDTPWAMLAIAAGANDPARWKVDSNSPVSFLNGINLVTAAANSGNAPEYYGLAILAYLAADRTDLLSNAGSGQIDLVAKLESYQSLTSGYFSPTLGNPAAATETTAWAVLGLVAAHQNGSPSVSSALAWLQAPAKSDGSGGGPNADGGFGSQPTTQSSTTITSLVAQALIAGKVATSNAVVQGAAHFIAGMQTSSGGFHDTTDGDANTPSTAWAIEGLRAAGVSADLAVNGHTPYTFLARLHRVNGSYNEFVTDMGDVMNATLQASIALSGKTLPVHRSSNALTRFAPSFSGAVLPKAGARSPIRTVLIRAAYRDNKHGTGINATAVRLTVDGKSKTAAAHITASGLHLYLTKLADGSHTFSIVVRDHAGNALTLQRSFTVSVPTGSASTGGGTHSGGSTSGSTTIKGGGSSGSGGTPTPHTTTPTPAATISPSQSVLPGATLTPTPSGSFPGSPTSPSPSASITGQVAGSSGSGGGGVNTAAVVGTTLAALVPLGFFGSWLVRRRLVGVMGGATRGEILPREASVWQRFWKPSGERPPAGGRE